MKLIIGGYAQGKLNYVLEHDGMQEGRVLDAALPEKGEAIGGLVIVNHLHCWIKAVLLRGGCPEEEISGFLKEYPGCVLISDEIGNGIVPIDAFEREYRERTGRLLVELAKQAEEVVRVICGIGQKIK